MKLSDLAKLIGGELDTHSDIEIKCVAKIEEAGPGDITFLANLKYKKHLSTTMASAVLIARQLSFSELKERKIPIHVVRVDDPYRAFLQLVDIFHPPQAPLQKGIHPTAVIPKSASIHENVAIGAHVTIGDKCKIGKSTSIYPGCVIGENVEIGESSVIYENVTVREGCLVGNRVIIHSGTVIGSDGFGFVPKPDGTYEKIPQRGIVLIDDDVEIGANCTIDRATIGETRIKRGVKLDNLIQIAHNVVIDEDTVIAAQSGISGSTKIGKNCIIAGQVGIVGHIKIADRTTFGAKSGIPKSIAQPDKTYFGYPAKELHRALRIEAVIRQLPELFEEIKNLKNRIENLEQKLKDIKQTDLKV